MSESRESTAEVRHPLEAMSAPPEEAPEEGGEQGEVKIHQNVIATIARLAALKVPGVAGLSPSFTQGVARLLGRPPDNTGIRILLSDEGVVVDLYLVVELGARIPQVAWQVQNDVRQAVEQMTGKNVKAVNVIVQGLREEVPPAREGEKAI